ncbi:MAG: hypothetical protein OWQ50_04810 [Acidianus infernus]|nr:hypothetical protein [Acidianus infernus]
MIITTIAIPTTNEVLRLGEVTVVGGGVVVFVVLVVVICLYVIEIFTA